MRCFKTDYDIDDFVYLIDHNEPKIRRSRIKAIKIIIGHSYKEFDMENRITFINPGIEVYYSVNVRREGENVYRDWCKEEDLYKKKKDVPIKEENRL